MTDVTVQPWLWIPRSEAQIEGEWQLEAEWTCDAGVRWSKAIGFFGSRDAEPNEAMTGHFTRILVEAVRDEWWVS